MGWWVAVQIIIAIFAVAASVNAKNRQKKTERVGLQVNRFGTDLPIPEIIGEREIGPAIVYQGTSDDPNNLPVKEYWFGILVWCGGEVEEIGDMYLDDLLASSFGFALTENIPVGAVADYEDGDGSRITHYTGLDQVNMPSWFSGGSFTSAPDEMTDMLFRGLCVSFVRLKMDSDFKKFPQGVPDFKLHIKKGKKIYDLVTQSSDHTTTNPISQAYWLITNRESGIGYDQPEDLDIDHLTSQTVFCNTLVDTPDETRPLKTSNMIVNTEDKIFDTLNELLGDLNASPVDGPNGLRIEVDRERESVMDLYDSDYLEGISSESLSTSERYNQVIIRFPDEDNRWKISEAEFPATGSDLYHEWLDSDNGVQLLLEEEVSTITNYYEVLQKCEMLARSSREGINVSIAIGAKGLYLEEMDVVTLTSTRRGWDKKPFQVREITIAANQVKLRLVEYQPSVFPWSNKDIKDDYLDTTIRNPFLLNAVDDLAFTINLDDPATAGLVSWTAPAGLVNFYRVIVKNLSDETIFNGRIFDTKYLLPNIPAGDYYVSVAAVNDNIASPLSILNFTLVAPVVPTVDIIESNFEIEIIPSIPSSLVGVVFELELSLTNDQNTAVNYGTSTRFTIATNPNTTYYLWVRTVSPIGVSPWLATSATSLNDNTVINDFIGLPALIGDVDDLIADMEDAINSVESLTIDFNKFEVSMNSAITIERNSREKTDAILLGLAAETAASREEIRRRIESGEVLTNAVVEVNPETGEIINKAFNYSDNQFSQASLRINGVDASIELLVERVTYTEDGIESLTSELNLLPAQITAIATSVVSDNLSALQPAHAFNFFDSTQGWVAVNGSITAGVDEVSTVWGDIENDSLNFDASENPLIRIIIERTAGAGWVGDIIIERDNSSTHTFSGKIEDPETGEKTLLVDFTGDSNYSGIVNRVRLVLGADSSDEFKISFITIGKADANTQDIQNLTARVTQAELDIDANTGEISNKVSTTYYENNTVTFSNAESVVNGLDSVISLIATQEQINQNDVVTKANQAAIFIDGNSSTITQIVNSLENDIDDNEQQISSVQTQVTELSQTTQLFAASRSDIQRIDDMAEFINTAASQGLRDFTKKQNIDSLAFAINTIELEIGPNGSIAKSILDLTSLTNSNSGLIESTAQRVTQVETDVSGNASAIDQILLSVTNVDNSLSATIGRLDQVETDSGDNAQAIAGLQLSVTNVDDSLTATINRVDQVEIDSGDNTQAISSVQLSVNNIDNSLTSTINRVDQVETDSGDNAQAIAGLQLSVTNVDDSLTATINRVDQVEIDTGNNAQSITGLVNTVESVDGKAESALTLSSSIDSSLNTYRSIAQLAVAADGRVSLVKLDANAELTTIIFQSDELVWRNSEGIDKLYLDSENDRLVYVGHIEAESGTFGGLLSAATGTIGSITTDPSGYLRTALPTDSGTRVVINGPDTPESNSIWVGDGAQTDLNSIFYIAKNGTKIYMKGGLVEGLAGLRYYAEISDNIVSVAHNSSEGGDVEITATCDYFRFYTSQSPVTSGVRSMPWTLKRGGVTLKSGSARASRSVNTEGGDYLVTEVLTMNLFHIDTSNGSGNLTYTFEIEDTSGVGVTYETTIRTLEDIVG